MLYVFESVQSLAVYIRYKLRYYKMHISQLRDQRAHRITNTLQLTYIPQLLAANIQYKCKNYKMHIPRTRARRAQIHPPTDIYHPIDGSIYPKPMYILQNVYSPFATDISSNCWQYIQYKCRYYIMYIAKPWAQRAHRHFETDIYLPIVGSIYPIQMYVYSPTLCPKST